MRIGVIVCVAAMALGVQPTRVRAQEGVPTVAIMDLSSFMMGEGGASVHLGKAVSAMLATEFGGRDGMRTIQRAELKALIRERHLQPSRRIDEADAIEVGRVLGVQYVLHGQVTSIVDNLRMDIRAVDVETSEIVSVMKKSDRTTELFSVGVELADEFDESLDLTAPSHRSEGEPIPVAATIAFSRGVDHEDRGRVGDAIEQYERALQIHPGHRDARRAPKRLRGERPS